MEVDQASFEINDSDFTENSKGTIAPLVFFEDQLNATKNRIIGGKLMDTNPFEFRSNEFASVTINRNNIVD